MKRILFSSLLLLSSLVVFAQKVSLSISYSKNSGLTDWKILDESQIIVYSGPGNPGNDTVSFSLEANNLYFLKISLAEFASADTNILTLFLNGEPLLLLKSDIGNGDHLFPFFTGIRSVNAKITGGVNTVISDFPWQVYYISGSFRCGGTIINNKWVLTAAHCTKNNSGGAIPASEMFVKVGVNNPANTLEGKTYSVTQVIVNEGYNDATLLNDIALLRIKDSINFPNASPIKLVSDEDVKEGATVPGVMTWVTGWGYTNINPTVVPTSLQKVQLPIVSNATASAVWGSIPSSDLMAGFLNGNKDACNGDSGGPMVVPVLDEFKLAGIVSWGSSNCNTYGAYTRVSDFLTWIQSKTGISPLLKPPKPVGDSIICHGTTTTQYSVTPVSGATVYEWNIFPASAGSIIGNSQAASVTWNLSYTGLVSIVMRVTINNSVSDWARLDVNISDPTHITQLSPDTEIPFGQNVNLQVTAEGYGLNYQWQKDGILIDNSNSPLLKLQNLNAKNIGLYKVEVSGKCGTEMSDTIYLYVKRSDIQSDPQVFLWPSVTTGNFTVAVNNDVNYNLRIFGTTGVKIREQLNCRFHTSVDIGTLASGVYIVEVYNKSFRKTIKVIKE